jgi:two-component system chemotaxis response regulator CheY
MKTLIVEDDLTSRILLTELLKVFGETHSVINGREALESFRTALATEEPYDLICLDIMMPEINGYEVLRRIRELEDSVESIRYNRVRIIMTTALCDSKNVIAAYDGLCDAYLVKPIYKSKLVEKLQRLKLIF